MDPSSPDYFRQLRLTLQLHLLVICNGIGGGVSCVTLVYFCYMLNGRAGLLAAIWMLGRHSKLFSSFLFMQTLAEDFELECGRPLPWQILFLLPPLHIIAFLLTIWYLYTSKVFLVPLLLFSSNPPWIVELLYIFVVLTPIYLYTPAITIRRFGPSITAQLTLFLVYPYEAWIKRKRLLLADTFIKRPAQGDKPSVLLPAFQYDPITEPGAFRLLKLMPVGGRMSVTLEQFPTDNCPPYWAVSYTWGSNKMDYALIFGVKDLPITESCASVLGLLTPLQTRYLWIDAICINQADLAEKALQVPLMSEIYSRAEQVVGCLSEIPIQTPAPADPRPSGLFNFLFERFIYKEVLISRGQNSLSPSFLFDLIRYLRLNSGDTSLRLSYRLRIIDWYEFCFLLSHPYWQRAWIVQEMVLAKKLILVYGEASFSWDHYRYAVNHLYERLMTGKVTNMADLIRVVPPLLVNLAAMSDRLDMLSEIKQSIESHTRSEWPSLVQVADQLYEIFSTDPRDQIFALLSLASDGLTPELKPNYDQSITYEDIIARVTLHSFENGHVNFLLCAGLGYRHEDHGPALPSWITVFPKSTRPREGNWAALKARKDSCHLQYLISADHKELSLRGVMVDEVAVLCTTSLTIFSSVVGRQLHKVKEEALHSQSNSNPDFDPVETVLDLVLDNLEKLPEFFRATRQLANQYVLEQCADTRRSDTYRRAMTMDWNGIAQGGTSPASWDTLTRFTEIEMAAISGDPETAGKINSGMDFEKNPFNHWACYDFAITRGGRIAWVPPRSKIGDVLCFFKGVGVPFLLRENEESENYSLIGDSYIQGLMHRESRGLDVEERWFKII